jgi:3-oxo-5alpha-steroid 4-dehydrogenase
MQFVNPEPHTVSPVDAPASDAPYDLIIVGFGGAGASAALEAGSRGARVLLIDRYDGGGATAMSGGVVYLGGGSKQQAAAGYDDNPEEMFRYLQFEVGDAVDEATLRAYCEESLDNLAFLEALGIPFHATGEAPKTSYPEPDVSLYFSGNELCPPYRDGARTAPRGHRALGKGLTGKVIFKYMRMAVEGRDIELRSECEAQRLIQNEDGRVVGVEIRELPRRGWVPALHRLLALVTSWAGLLTPGFATRAKGWIEAIESRHGVVSQVFASRGVVLSAGGFVFNRKLIRELAPLFAESMPLGCVGDDGSGIAMGVAAGAKTARMDRCTAFRFINPPVALTRGVLVDSRGERICNEEYYGATLGDHIGYGRGGRARLIIDAATKRRILVELWQFRKLNFQSTAALLNLYVNRVKADSLESLAQLCEMPRDALRKTLDEYNLAIREGDGDPLGKSEKVCVPLDQAPWYAINCDFDTPWFPTPTFTVGGVVVDGKSGAVLREDGSEIPGLFSAGRNAVGISSESYVSGLSVGDCIFSGRRAARAALTDES